MPRSHVWHPNDPAAEEGRCEVCGCYPDDCICPECKECGSVGDLRCYDHHGLEMTAEQEQSKRFMDGLHDPDNREDYYDN